MSACCWCGAAEGGIFDQVHWEGCRMISAYREDVVTVHHRSQPPRMTFDLNGVGGPMPRTARACYACWEALPITTWPVTYTWGSGIHERRGPGWIPLCQPCLMQRNADLEALLNRGAHQNQGQVAWAATPLTADEMALYQPIADAVRHWDDARRITDLVPVAYRLGYWEDPWIRLATT